MRAVLPWLAAAALLAQSQPTFYAAYEDGLEHEKAGRWREALAAYQRAIALHPRPAARVVIYGNNLLLDYYPYLRSARCQAELGLTEAARAMLARGEAAGEPEGQHRELSVRLGPPKPPPPAAPPVPSAATHAPSAATHVPPAAAPAEPPPGRPTEGPAAGPEAVPPKAAVDPSSRPVQPVVRQAAPAPPPPPLATPDRPPRNRPAAAAPSAADRAVAAPTGIPAWAKVSGFAAAAVVLLWALLRRRRRDPDSGYHDPVQVGPYRIGRLLGRGGFASTYQAWHVESGQTAALKVLHPFRQEDPEFLQRFRQEAQLGALLDHPNLVRMIGQGDHGGLSWIAMEYVSGERLDQRLRAAGPLAITDAVRLGGEIASAMAHAHSHGVVHRDLKPSNVMLAEGCAKVMDFGISRRMDAQTLTTTYAFLGTPLYAAPEVQLKTQVGPAADRYALGIMLFEMLAGRPPFTGETPFEILDQHRSAALPDLAALRPDAPPQLRRLVERLCRKQPDERPDDAEVLRVLEEVAAQEGGASAPRD